MAEILTDKFVQRLSKRINPKTISADDFSVNLGFTEAEGAGAAIGANVVMNQQSAYGKILSKYVFKHGRTSKSALNLRELFLESGMTDCSDFVKAELEKFNIPFRSDEEILMEMNKPVSLPNPPCGTPGEGAEAAGTTQTDTKEQALTAD